MRLSTSFDGLVASTSPAVAAAWEQTRAGLDATQRQWSTYLERLGVKLEHPDDAWVQPTLPIAERGDGVLGLSTHVRFDSRPRVGDLLALGGPPPMMQGYRLVRVTRIERRDPAPRTPAMLYHFTDTGRRVTAMRRAPRLCGLLRIQ